MTASESPDGSIGETPEGTQDSWVVARDRYLKVRRKAQAYLLPEVESNRFGGLALRLARAGLEVACYAAGTVGQEFGRMKSMGVDFTEPSQMFLDTARFIEKKRQMDRLARLYPYLYSWMVRTKEYKSISKRLDGQSKASKGYKDLLQARNNNREALNALEPIAYEELTRLRLGRGDFSLLDLPTDGIDKKSIIIHVERKINYILSVMEQMKVIFSVERLVSSFGLTPESVEVILEEYKNHNRENGHFFLGYVISRYGETVEGPNTPLIRTNNLVLYPPERRKSP